MTRPPVVLGLDFGGTKIAVAVCDLSGRVSAPRRSRAWPRREPKLRLRVASLRDMSSWPRWAPESTLAGVGAATLGIPYDDRVRTGTDFSRLG